MTKEERRIMLLQKLEEMKVFENEIHAEGIRYIAGIDEVEE